MIKWIDDIDYIVIYERYLELTEYDFDLLEHIFDMLISLKRKHQKSFFGPLEVT